MMKILIIVVLLVISFPVY
ncbi:TPA: type I toxin-antitoxin system Ibs family toxin [Escherichia coli]|nr:type I toxin-antitoxin system Ibs family toxin [Escherichia coli]ELO1079137.1 type I toxin-antitoxin system Ibs family toxin [Escherichia coli]HAI4894295.1 type I toxin-antitoxin system Ibs family toxin [Escherichia coli]HAI4923739.1 type I toxin-antitoxin system Ibs family toxin [Escherichia coli]HAI6520239.1 type I toxin-antitoxin system Ibs family toxin [Escherichia coli]